MTYVLSEKIMTASPPATKSPSIEAHNGSTTTSSSNGTRQQPEPNHISVRANCAMQGIVAVLLLTIWQAIYTFPRRQALIFAPMAAAGTSSVQALGILGAIAVANLIHAVTFFATLKDFPGGATSAGVLKGLQAVMVFALSAAVLCGKWGGVEMCWSRSKGLSLLVVVCGILLYGSVAKKSGGGRADPSRKLLLGKGRGSYQSVGGDGKIMCV